ncbi:MAG: putative ABC transporter permease [Clostridiaceae bacterium]
MKEILIIFMIYGIVGWIWETSYVSICQRKLINRGFLHGPFIPIYAYASLTIILSMKVIEQYLPENIILYVLAASLGIALVASIWEYVTSAILEKLFKTRWWDYSDRKFNLNGRIALDYSIGWGAGGYVFWKYINKTLLTSFESLSPDIIEILLAIFYTLFVLDTIVTIRELITLRQIMVKLDMISKELSNKAIYNIETLNSEIEERKEKLKQKVDKSKEVLDEKIVLLVKKGDVTLTSGQKKLIYTFNSLLERSKYVSRFYRNYPKAYSGKFKKILKVIKYIGTLR